MHRDVHASRKRPLATAQHDGRKFAPLLNLAQRRGELVHHLEVKNVERRMSESDARQSAIVIDGKAAGSIGWHGHIEDILITRISVCLLSAPPRLRGEICLSDPITCGD